MVQVGWTSRAARDLAVIEAYIAEENPVAARRIAERIRAAAMSLSTQSERGRPVRGRVRELVHVRPYIIRYRVEADRVFILHIRHSARRPLP